RFAAVFEILFGAAPRRASRTPPSEEDGHFQCRYPMIGFQGVHCISIDGLLAEHLPCARGIHSGNRSDGGRGP
ncbi:MAG: hypothetical protein EBU81_08310, partial [Proteobacteria bacterium]|nr:hypothetical protein [Pseudomonadota bacterium]